MLYRAQQQRQAHIQRPKRVENVQAVLAEYTSATHTSKDSYAEQHHRRRFQSTITQTRSNQTR